MCDRGSGVVLGALVEGGGPPTTTDRRPEGRIPCGG